MIQSLPDRIRLDTFTDKPLIRDHRSRTPRTELRQYAIDIQPLGCGHLPGRSTVSAIDRAADVCRIISVMAPYLEALSA